MKYVCVRGQSVGPLVNNQTILSNKQVVAVSTNNKRNSKFSKFSLLEKTLWLESVTMQFLRLQKLQMLCSQGTLCSSHRNATVGLGSAGVHFLSSFS